MKMLFGGIYTRKNETHYNDQSYGIYIPVIYKEGEKLRYRMVDTHMVENPCWGSDDMTKRIWYLEQADCGETSWKIFFGPSNYYYKNFFELESDELKDSEWELVADLHDYRIVDDIEVYDYLDEDVLIHMPLWDEDFYRWHSRGVGRNYVKKYAKKDGYKVFRNGLSNNSFGFSDYTARKMKDICEDVLKNMKVGYGKKKEIRDTIKRAKKYLQLSDEYYRFCASLNKKGNK